MCDRRGRTLPFSSRPESVSDRTGQVGFSDRESAKEGRKVEGEHITGRKYRRHPGLEEQGTPRSLTMAAIRLPPPQRVYKTPSLRIRYSSSSRNHSSSRASSTTASSPSLDFTTLRHLFTRLHPSHVWSQYNHLLRTHPLKTRMITSGTLFVIGDMISQHVIEERPFGPGVWSDEAHATSVEERRQEGHVWVRTARLAFYGVSSRRFRKNG